MWQEGDLAHDSEVLDQIQDAPALVVADAHQPLSSNRGSAQWSQNEAGHMQARDALTAAPHTSRSGLCSRTYQCRTESSSAGAYLLVYKF